MNYIVTMPIALKSLVCLLAGLTASQAADLKHPPHTALDIVGALERCGLTRFGATLRTGGLS